MIKETMTKDGFINGIKQVRPDNFTNNGACALFDYLENLSEDTGEIIEYDPIAFCCEYSEYESSEEAEKDLGSDCFQVVAVFNGGILIQEF